MFQPPGTPEMMRVVHEVEMIEARRRARLHREASGGTSLRRSIGRALIAIGVSVGGELPRTLLSQDGASVGHSAPSTPRSATADPGC